MKAADPDINNTEVLNFAFSEPISAVDKYGKPVLNNDLYKVIVARVILFLVDLNLYLT